MKEKISNFWHEIKDELKDIAKDIWPIGLMIVALFLCMSLGMCDFAVMPG